jgi:hypothetical protein
MSKRRKTPHSQENKLTPELKAYFFRGFDFGRPLDETYARQLWNIFVLPVMREWLSAPANLGKRPCAWWKFNRPPGELRRQLGGPPALAGSPLWYGFPGHWPCKNLIFEPEVQFLRRLNQLTRAEYNQYPTLLAAQRAEIRAEALRNSVPEPARLQTPCAIYTEAELDALLKDE